MLAEEASPFSNPYISQYQGSDPARKEKHNPFFESKKPLLVVALLLAGLVICTVNVRREAPRSAPPPAISAIVQTERPKQKAAVESVKKVQEKPVKVDWSKLVTVSSSNYGYGVLGGINNLSVLFANRSDHVIDEISAKITYLKANGKPWKTKFVSVFHVLPHSEKRQPLPKVNRGKSVEVTIHRIVSKKMQLNYTGK